jgi:hypothetical protein
MFVGGASLENMLRSSSAVAVLRLPEACTLGGVVVVVVVAAAGEASSM